MVMKKKQFERPAVLQEVRLHLERNFVDSVVDDCEAVETAGQEVGDVFEDASSGTFNHSWE